MKAICIQSTGRYNEDESENEDLWVKMLRIYNVKINNRSGFDHCGTPVNPNEGYLVEDEWCLNYTLKEVLVSIDKFKEHFVICEKRSA